MRVRRQTAISEVDAPAIEELAAGRDSDEHRRVTVLGDADGSGSQHHVKPVPQERYRISRLTTTHSLSGSLTAHSI